MIKKNRNGDFQSKSFADDNSWFEIGPNGDSVTLESNSYPTFGSITAAVELDELKDIAKFFADVVRELEDKK